MGRYFGTDGFRGEANVVLTAEHAFRIGCFLGWYFTDRHNKSGSQGHPRVVIGKDTRRSGDMLEYSLAGGLTAGGADVWLMHVTTTPSVSDAVRKEGFDAGIVISASHNPYYDNGIKLLGSGGEKMDESVICLLEDCLDGKQKLPLAYREQIGSVVDFGAARSRYIDFLAGLGIGSLRGIKVGLDCANGATWQTAPQLFRSLGAQLFVINNTPNGCNINDNCGSTHLEGLQRLVLEQKLDVGFAYDGDGDRCLCVDERGQVVTGDHILYICGKYLKERGQLRGDHVVATVMSNYGLTRAFEKLGIQCTRSAVGDRYVYEQMLACGSCLGGEQSGHIIFSQYAPTGDGILTSLKVMEVMLAEKKALSRLCESLELYPQVQENVPAADRDVLKDPQVRNAVEGAEKMLRNHGRILVRPSGTEPVIRVMAEAADAEKCRMVVDQIVKAIQKRI